MDELIACHECDLIHRVKSLPKKATAMCSRCGAVLYRNKPNSLERTLALTLAGLILLVLANCYPFLGLKIESQYNQATLISGILELYRQHHPALAMLVLLTTILAPLTQLLGILYVLVLLRFNRVPPKLAVVFKIVRGIQPWSMMEVFMLAILVSVVKLASMARIVPGISIYSFFALIVVLTLATISLDPVQLWEKLEGHQ